MQLAQEIIDLGPWHHDVQVTPEVSTAISLDHDYGRSYAFSKKYRPEFVSRMKQLYPDGRLQGKRFLDCACNGGGYCFWARDLGAEECVGFDVREHWINQAEFLLRHRTLPKDNIHFHLSDLYDVPSLNLQPFDITLFKGIFYHLPDPITGLKIAADLTTELILLDTATIYGEKDGFLAVASESTEIPMSGVHGLNWFPTGAGVLKKILRWMGFKAFRVFGHHQTKIKPDRGRLSMAASRHEDFFGHFDLQKAERQSER
jgi:SAM-dependent methyltransferase